METIGLSLIVLIMRLMWTKSAIDVKRISVVTYQFSYIKLVKISLMIIDVPNIGFEDLRIPMK